MWDSVADTDTSAPGFKVLVLVGFPPGFKVEVSVGFPPGSPPPGFKVAVCINNGSKRKICFQLGSLTFVMDLRKQIHWLKMQK